MKETDIPTDDCCAAPCALPALAAAPLTEDEQQLALLCKALAHPARLRILKTLLSQQSCVSGAIAEALPLAQSTVSQHLKQLKDSGLIQGEIDGPRVCYCINHQRLRQLKILLAEQL